MGDGRANADRHGRLVRRDRRWSEKMSMAQTFFVWPLGASRTGISEPDGVQAGLAMNATSRALFEAGVETNLRRLLFSHADPRPSLSPEDAVTIWKVNDQASFDHFERAPHCFIARDDL